MSWGFIPLEFLSARKGGLDVIVCPEGGLGGGLVPRNIEVLPQLCSTLPQTYLLASAYIILFVLSRHGVLVVEHSEIVIKRCLLYPHHLFYRKIQHAKGNSQRYKPSCWPEQE